MKKPLRRAVRLIALLMLALLCACAAPRAQQADATSPKPFPANPLEHPPAAGPVTAKPYGPLNPDRRCRTDADCTVKDVGNCCGTYPQCVNAGARVDRTAVAADCRAKGMASVCGFPVINGCHCVQGQCAADNTAR